MSTMVVDVLTASATGYGEPMQNGSTQISYGICPASGRHLGRKAHNYEDSSASDE